MVETSETSIPLCRDFIPELLRVVAEGADDTGAAWNAVESLELLIDAGAFREAETLAGNVIQMLGGDRRNRLFRAYQEFARLVQGGSMSESLNRIEASFAEIESGGFSAADQSWSAIILSRAIQVGVYSRAIGEGEVFRAREILSRRFAIECGEDAQSMRVKVGLELAKTYIHAPAPEIPAARGLLRSLVAECGAVGVKPEVSFDVQRALFNVSIEETKDGKADIALLRSAARPLGGVARGLAELAIGRYGGGSKAERAESLEKALALFEESAYRSGEFEAAIALARGAAEQDHHAKAYRLFARADSIAADGGFIFGRGVALLGLFHSALASNELGLANAGAETLRELSKLDLFVSAFGLNTIAVYQLTGKMQDAIALAGRCEKMFASRGLASLAGQAAFMFGASHAECGNWKVAQSAWKRALVCDELTRNIFGACDRRAALAQALAMANFTQRGRLEDSTRKTIGRLLEKSDKALEPYGESTRALEARGRTLQVHAQLAILGQTPLDALRQLSKARECFTELGCEREVAITDGLTGLALLEASKHNGSKLQEEAMMSLQRALEFFTRSSEHRITWKVRYYLAVAAMLRSQQVSDRSHREGFRQMAAGLLEEATLESERCQGEVGMPRASSGEGDFAPGLNPEVLEALKGTLGLITRRKEKGAESPEDPSKSNRFRGYLH